MDCEVCGKPATTRAIIEGARLSVCGECAELGQELIARQPPAQKRQFVQEKKSFTELALVEGFGKTVSQAREKTGLNVYQLGAKLSINADYLKQIERGDREPDEKTGRKLEAVLKIKLFE